MSGVTIREGDVIPRALQESMGLVRESGETPRRAVSRPAAVGPAVAEASFGEPPPAQASGFDVIASLGAGIRPKRAVTWFVFPAEIHDEMPEVTVEHRAFAICRLKAVEEQQAQANASGTSFMAAFTEQVKLAVWKIGRDDALFDLREGLAVYGPGGWWEAIGPKGRQLVARCYAEINGVSDELGEKILATKTPGWA
jgi:hypothetical protein